MPIKNPRTPYERAYNAWSYGGGQQRGEPMPRARDFPSSDSERDAPPRGAPDGARGYGMGGPQAPYQGPPMDDGIGTYDPRTPPQPPAGGYPGSGRMEPVDRPPDQGPRRRYTSQEKQALRAQHGDVRGQEQRRLAESPDVVQRARAYEQRRQRPQYSGTSLGALNRR